MIVNFNEDEYLIMAMSQKENRQQTMCEIRSIVPFVKDDADVLTLLNSTLEKMEYITDEQFSRMDLEPYRQEPLEEE